MGFYDVAARDSPKRERVDSIDLTVGNLIFLRNRAMQYGGQEDTGEEFCKVVRVREAGDRTIFIFCYRELRNSEVCSCGGRNIRQAIDPPVRVWLDYTSADTAARWSAQTAPPCCRPATVVFVIQPPPAAHTTTSRFCRHTEGLRLSFHASDTACVIMIILAPRSRTHTPPLETVWRTAQKHEIPAIAFVNKLDRDGADFKHVLGTLERRLGVIPLPLQVGYLRW